MRPFLLLVFLLLAGCATHSTLGVNALSRNDLGFAERELIAAIREGDTDSWYNLGVTYMRQGRRADAERAFEMGARYGQPMSQAALGRLGKPVPRADLVQANNQSQSNSQALGELLDSFNRGYRSGINCRTISTGGGDSVTRCD